LLQFKINNTCKACGACPLITKGAINFSEVSVEELREAAFDAERTGDWSGVETQLSKIRVAQHLLTDEQLLHIQEICYVKAMEILR
jgi:hypothetical protein